jgi:hypothetical protein
MPNNQVKIGAKLLDVVYLLDENEVESEMGEAFAAFMLNPTVTWAKFILTDDRTNGNGQRIPKEEFPNLIKSGIHMPVKMVNGEIEGHPNSKPLGTITHLKQVTTEDGSSAIVALAALWGQERPADVKYIKQRFADKQPVDVSWEILFEDSTLNAETNSEDLHGTVLRAATIVGNPAYEGRTPFLAIASKNAAVTDETNTEDTLMEAKDLEARLAELEPKLTEAESQLAQLQSSLTEKDAEIARLTEENTAQLAELDTLRQYKASIEAEAEKIVKLDAIKTKFVEAGLKKDDQYFADHAERFLKMSEDDLNFFVQELVANIPADGKSSSASLESQTKIPALTGSEDTEDLSVQGLAKYLRERKSK